MIREESFTMDYFLDQFREFMDLLGNKSTTREMAFTGWNALFYVAVNVGEPDERIDTALVLGQENLVRRLPYLERQVKVDQ